MTGLEGKVALVTGASKGIGAEIARSLGEQGVMVGVNYLSDQAGAEAVVRHILGLGRRCIAVHGDVGDPQAVTTMVKKVEEELGPIAILVNNAGVARHTPFIEMEEEEWNWMFQVHVYGTCRCIWRVLPGMIARKGGAIVNIISELALVGETGLSHYVAAKCAVIGLTKSLAREVGPLGIRVNAVAPGPVDTQMLTDAERSEEFIRALPLRRLGLPQDIAPTVSLLCSDEGSWFTGQVISPNGGAVI